MLFDDIFRRACVVVDTTERVFPLTQSPGGARRALLLVLSWEAERTLRSRYGYREDSPLEICKS